MADRKSEAHVQTESRLCSSRTCRVRPTGLSEQKDHSASHYRARRCPAYDEDRGRLQDIARGHSDDRCQGEARRSAQRLTEYACRYEPAGDVAPQRKPLRHAVHGPEPGSDHEAGNGSSHPRSAPLRPGPRPYPILSLRQRSSPWCRPQARSGYIPPWSPLCTIRSAGRVAPALAIAPSPLPGPPL